MAAFLSLMAFVMTETELKLIAAVVIMGESVSCEKYYAIA